MTGSGPVEIEVPALPHYVGVLRLAIAALARKEGFDEERVEELRIVVSEAVTNAVVAAEDGAEVQPISVKWSAKADGPVTIEVHTAVGLPEDEANLEDSQGISTQSALSLALLQSLVDQVTVTPTEGGTTTLLTVAR